jgi:hypothetical protein
MEVLAYYLPQFHPIEENNLWWGPGFTEWTNVTKAQKLFRGHDQPHLPRELGFYDLRIPETRHAQAELASSHGVTGFIYWHYWFAGRRLLERPFDEVLDSKEPDFPFALAWANHSWTGVWHGPGGIDQILMEQTYPGVEDEHAHYDYLRRAFADDRYVRIDGKPLFFVYAPGEIPDPAGWVERWQKMAEEFGGLYLVACLGSKPYETPLADGFDASVYFRFPFGRDLRTKVRERLQEWNLRRGPRRYPYAETLDDPPAWIEGTIHPCVFANWDNTPRAGRNGIIALGSNPDRFRSHLRRGIDVAKANPQAEQMVILKSWNEWAEGNYLEPDQEFGLGWLEAIATELDAAGVRRTPKERP